MSQQTLMDLAYTVLVALPIYTTERITRNDRTVVGLDLGVPVANPPEALPAAVIVTGNADLSPRSIGDPGTGGVVGIIIEDYYPQTQGEPDWWENYRAHCDALLSALKPVNFATSNGAKVTVRHEAPRPVNNKANVVLFQRTNWTITRWER